MNTSHPNISSNSGILERAICPHSRQPLKPATESVLQKIVAEQERGLLKYQSGETVSDGISGGLVTEDESLFYPEHNGIQVLLASQAIKL